MTGIRQRLRKLESRLTDTTGLAPYSEPWFAYWENILAQYLAGENPQHPGKVPLVVADRLIERADREMGLIQ